MSRKLFGIAMIAGVFLFGSQFCFAAGNTTTQTVSYEVQAINEIAVSGPPGALTVSAATAGSAPNAVTDNTTTYSVTTNQAGNKISCSIDSVMPNNTTLNMTLAAPTGGSSAGATALTTTPTVLATCVAGVAGTFGITYEFSATVAAGVVASANKTVTLTVAP